ncbi:MAG TPA: 2OG-Fe(II) oxygenase family protein [Burkholderiaceae bacterium]|nr:2OG-Fe(II) oxygenase family protein [Burkholderiaceae bacterium]
MQVPTIDISPFMNDPRGDGLVRRAEVARQWNEAYATIGFANVVGHGIALEELQAIQTAGRSFFDLPLEEKQRASFAGEKRSQGYFQLGLETVNKAFDARSGQDAPPDLVETLTFAFADWEQRTDLTAFEASIYRPNLWPQQPLGLEALLRRYHAQVSNIARVLMEISAAALGLQAGFFEPYYRRMATSLRLAHYPEQPTEPKPGQLRYGAHTDYMGFTLLLQDDAPGGLQVQDTEGRWIDAPPLAGAFTVNCGDLLSRWTNGRWRSNIHRVVNPPRGLLGSSRRLSVVMFTGPDYEAQIECLPTCRSEEHPASFPPVRCWDHFQSKVNASLT